MFPRLVKQLASEEQAFPSVSVCLLLVEVLNTIESKLGKKRLISSYLLHPIGKE